MHPQDSSIQEHEAHGLREFESTAHTDPRLQRPEVPYLSLRLDANNLQHVVWCRGMQLRATHFIYVHQELCTIYQK
eukprot:1065054-Pelagomonas_calceolata.AAC.2